MSLALVHSRARAGIDAPAVRVEVHLSGGLPAVQIVGLPEAAVRESRDRVRAALLCARFEWPQRRITINLAPADLPKEGGRFDLPIALGILAASGQIPLDSLHGKEFLGELALTGELRPVDAVIPAVIAAHNAGNRLILPQANAEAAALVSHASTAVAQTLLQVCAALQGQQPLPAPEPGIPSAVPAPPDMRDVRGQAQARRALEVAAAGGHHLLLVGPPGCGKSMLASRLPGLLPPLGEHDALETASIHSLAQTFQQHITGNWRQRPFRAPHHSASAVALVGGGSHPRPGEISLAHNGVLFLDELTQWQRPVLEVLREPLETGQVTIARAARSTTFPARFQLVAAMNPCPCGWAGDSSGRCHCSNERTARYLGHISGPLLDRIDLQVRIPRLPLELLSSHVTDAEDSATIALRVWQAQQRQCQRQGCSNAHLDAAGTFSHCPLDGPQQHLLQQAAERLQLSMRAVQRSLRVARTIADLQGHGDIQRADLAEALGYRQSATTVAN
jgi:magnesium chelatase family protein